MGLKKRIVVPVVLLLLGLVHVAMALLRLQAQGIGEGIPGSVLLLLAGGVLFIVIAAVAGARAIGLSLRVVVALGFVVAAVAGLLAALAAFNFSLTVRGLFQENKRLKEAVASLTHEDQIGYAKVVAQKKENGRLLTTVKFVETMRDDKAKVILEKEYTVEGDIVHFDALIVKFDAQAVMDGRERALYLWRRVYGEKMAPEDSFPIETQGAEPRRYADLLKRLSLRERALFWTKVWDLANDPDRLKRYGVRAVYGNDVYFKLQEGSVYLFKINNSGQVFPETVPAM